jgi:hypothetical protein
MWVGGCRGAKQKWMEYSFANLDKYGPSNLISPGSGGHAYVFTELGYSIHLRGHSVFILPKHSGYPVNALIKLQSDALKRISINFNYRIGVIVNAKEHFIHNRQLRRFGYG